MTEITAYADTDNQILPRTKADEVAEQRVDAIEQERFDAFSPNQDPTATWSETHRKLAQTAVRVNHAIEMGTGGRGAHDADSRGMRDKERVKVGLPPTYRN